MRLPRFNKRPAHTLLYITEVKTFRIDTDRKGVMSGEVQVIDVTCESASALPIAIENIIEQSNRKLGKTVWLLYARLNTYQLTLPAIQVQGVDSEILQQALQFEYEALTGDSLANSKLAYHFLGTVDEMSSYWVNLLATETFDGLIQKLKKASCKLGGLTHPGGFPALLSGTDEASWLRVECWPNVVFALAKSPEQGFSLQVFPNGEGSDWQEQINQWILEIGNVDKSEAIMNNQLEYIPPTDENYHLTLDGALIFWLSLWAQHLITEETPAAPLLNNKTNINMEWVYMIGGGVTALVLCGSHALWMVYQTNEYTYQFEQLTKADKDIKSVRKDLTKNRDKQMELQNQVSIIGGNINVIPNALKGLQKRPAQLLRHLALGSPDDLVTEEITVQDHQIIVTGVALKADLSNQLAGHIEPELAKVGWKVNPPTKKEMAIFNNGGPWSFEIVIEDLGLQGFSKE